MALNPFYLGVEPPVCFAANHTAYQEDPEYYGKDYDDVMVRVKDKEQPEENDV